MNKWTVHVTDFGKIEKADVEVAPLTLFVGDNNSGKSYMMTLIYGLLHVRFYFEKYVLETDSEVYKKCCRILGDLWEKSFTERKIWTMNQKEIELFQELINITLKKNMERFLHRLFNREMDIGNLWLEFSKKNVYEIELSVSLTGEESSEGVIIRGNDGEGKPLPGYGTETDEMDKEDTYHFFLAYIMEYMIKKDMDAMTGSTSLYLPTARTGFLLTYKTLVGSAMQDKFNYKEREQNLLTRPNSDFLTRLSSMTMQREHFGYDAIIEFIEEHIITGRITVSDMPTHDVMYVPEGAKQPLPMFVTSGVVTEITPLLLFLQYGNIKTLLMEEPEISLHPELQWEMARVLIRLTNAGMPVFITTHSDIILQHINNMIKLSKSSEKREIMQQLQYEKEDLLQAEDVAVYQFDVKENQRTQVTELPCGDYGFEAMTFYKTLEKLNSQISQIESGEE